MEKTIKVAALGLGRLGLFHAQNLRNRIPGTELVCVVDTNEEHAQRMAKELNIEKWTTNPSDVFNDQEIDAVVITTPTSTHGEMIKQAARNKKHIFVEKPLTSTLEEADEVIDVLNEMNVICQVGFMRRFDPAYHAAKLQIDAGKIGEPLYIKGITRDQGAPPASFIKYSGGIFLDCSIHDYDIARYLMGSEIIEISGHGQILVNDFMAEYNDVDQALSFVKFANGAAGDFEASRNSPYGHDIRTEVIGTEGSIFIGTLRNENITLLNSKGSSFEVIPNFQTRFNDAYCLEIEEFINCIKTGTSPRVGAVDSKINMEIALAATKSFHNNGVIEIIHSVVQGSVK